MEEESPAEERKKNDENKISPYKRWYSKWTKPGQ